MATKLKPCPFCGGKSRVRKVGKGEYTVVSKHTDECCFEFLAWEFYFDTKANAIEAWNRRVSE